VSCVEGRVVVFLLAVARALFTALLAATLATVLLRGVKVLCCGMLSGAPRALFGCDELPVLGPAVRFSAVLFFWLRHNIDIYSLTSVVLAILTDPSPTCLIRT